MADSSTVKSRVRRRRRGSGLPLEWILLLLVLLLVTVSSLVIVLGFFGTLGPNNVLPAGIPVPLIALVITTVLFALALCYWASRNILKPIRTVNEAFEKLARGDFETPIEVHSSVREMDEMIEMFNTMQRELRQVRSLRTDFVSNVSHEFKTPLAAIDGYAALVENEVKDDDRLAEWAHRIRTNTADLTGMTECIMAISRLDNGGEVTDRSVEVRFYLDEQIRNCIVNSEHAWAIKEVEFDLDLEEVEFIGDEAVVSRIWHNVLDNAVKFSPHGGKITVSLHKVDSKAGLKAVAEVLDEGPGMTEEECTVAFAKFQKAQSAQGHWGHGLGLALVSSATRYYGGTAVAESPEDGGCLIRIELPISK